MVIKQTTNALGHWQSKIIKSEEGEIERVQIFLSPYYEVHWYCLKLKYATYIFIKNDAIFLKFFIKSQALTYRDLSRANNYLSKEESDNSSLFH